MSVELGIWLKSSQWSLIDQCGSIIKTSGECFCRSSLKWAVFSLTLPTWFTINSPVPENAPKAVFCYTICAHITANLWEFRQFSKNYKNLPCACSKFLSIIQGDAWLKDHWRNQLVKSFAEQEGPPRHLPLSCLLKLSWHLVQDLKNDNLIATKICLSVMNHVTSFYK